MLKKQVFIKKARGLKFESIDKLILQKFWS
jgi:hypothetical protein